MAQVVLKGVGKEYPGGVRAVEGFNLSIADGELIVLVGPSGCGKSTTLRMIAGLEEVTDGSIIIGDRVVNDVAPKDRDIAMVFQNYALYPHMSVYKNIAFGLKLRKVPRKEIKETVHEVAETLGLTDLLHRKPKALSGGQRQRVALGRAIVRDPKVFLFDEPLSNLDAQLRVQMRAEIGRLHSRLNTTMVYVTHDQVEAMTLGDRIVVMLDGVIQQVATPSDLYAKPVNKFVAGFIGSPPMNFLEGRIEAEGDELMFVAPGSVRLRIAGYLAPVLEPYKDKEITMGIRPELFSHPVEADRVANTSVTGNVDVVEPLGAEAYVHLTVGDTSITARMDSEELPSVNESFTMDVDMSKVQFFDPQSERTILG
ncbi:MAG: sn-glycerol-3-phosphate ABC transporter ATP-binding protein UgpC [Candidatus Hydrogenedentota bacterium]